MSHSIKTHSPLRQRMIDDMTMRKLGDKTQLQYIRAVKRFAQFYGHSPAMATAEDLRRFQMKMVEDGVSGTTINATITGLRFFFEVTLGQPHALKKMSSVRVAQTLPVVLSSEDVARLLEGPPTSKPGQRCRWRTGLACGPAK